MPNPGENQQPINGRLEAMISGIGQGSAQNPMSAPPSANQPGGLPQPFDPLASKFDLMAKGLKALGEAVKALGDDKTGVELEKMGVEIQHKLVQRTNAFVKAQEAKSKLTGGQPNYSQVGSQVG